MLRIREQIKQSVLIAMSTGLVFSACPVFAGDTDSVIGSNEARTENAITASKIQWETSLDKAKLKSAQSGKPILWIHMLGNVDGFT
ncbi:MAG: hypothetical protein IAF58_13700 [Leptolyngbya sp.]|nr:hypothetical protein [Candidatus Melainabacteria bacterium]